MSPMKAMRPCSYPGCPELVKSGKCERHAKQEQRRQDDRRGSANERGYNYRWQKVRLAYLNRHPLCAECERAGKIVPANVVDHIIPHKGNQSLFWNVSNWQPLCKQCHDIKTASEDGGFGRG
jgi:5-methylcytosine-specific restriction protein A